MYTLSRCTRMELSSARPIPGRVLPALVGLGARRVRNRVRLLAREHVQLQVIEAIESAAPANHDRVPQRIVVA